MSRRIHLVCWLVNAISFYSPSIFPKPVDSTQLALVAVTLAFGRSIFSVVLTWEDTEW